MCLICAGLRPYQKTCDYENLPVDDAEIAATVTEGADAADNMGHVYSMGVGDAFAVPSRISAMKTGWRSRWKPVVSLIFRRHAVRSIAKRVYDAQGNPVAALGDAVDWTRRSI
ncbi:MAG: hypothetical protein JKP98_14535 [Rhodobacteraceae bacterium]|nr:hypothetical protein [Paracoccaceae bacterium]